jgi:hypothetical protein
MVQEPTYLINTSSNLCMCKGYESHPNVCGYARLLEKSEAPLGTYTATLLPCCVQHEHKSDTFTGFGALRPRFHEAPPADGRVGPDRRRLPTVAQSAHPRSVGHACHPVASRCPELSCCLFCEVSMYS